MEPFPGVSPLRLNSPIRISDGSIRHLKQLHISVCLVPVPSHVSFLLICICTISGWFNPVHGFCVRVLTSIYLVSLKDSAVSDCIFGFYVNNSAYSRLETSGSLSFQNIWFKSVHGVLRPFKGLLKAFELLLTRNYDEFRPRIRPEID